MLSKVSECLAGKLAKSNVIEEEDLEVYQFGIESFIMKVCHFISYVAIGLLFHRLPQLLLFLAAFIPLRECSGGYHARTPLKCYILSCGTVITFLCLYLFMPVDKTQYSIILAVISSLILFFIVPVETENKPLSEAERTYYKSKAGFIIIIELALVLIFRMVSWNELSFILAMSLTYELMIALAGLSTKKGKKTIVN